MTAKTCNYNSKSYGTSKKDGKIFPDLLSLADGFVDEVLGFGLDFF